MLKIKNFLEKQKTYDNWRNRASDLDPTISFIIQSHNKSKAVFSIVTKLREFKNFEIIVIDDGSMYNHTRHLVNFLHYGNEFLIRSNDLYEVITYDRAIYFARGKHIVLLQDDDYFSNLNWVNEAIRYFEEIPNLAILGGREGINFLHIEGTPDGKKGEYVIDGDIAQRKNLFKFKLLTTTSFCFVQAVNRAPMWINRELFMNKIKHIDQSFAPFLWDDAEICLRAYLNDLLVGLYNANFERGSLGVGGMRIWNNELHQHQDSENAKKIYSLYSEKFEQIKNIVDISNKHFRGNLK